MQLLDYLRIVRRRWPYVALAAVVAFAAGWLTAPGAGNRPVRHGAETTLLVNPSFSGAINLDQLALLVSRGDVPVRAAALFADLHPGRDLPDARAEADREVGSLTIAVTTGSPDTAEAAGAAYTDALLESLTAESDERFETDQVRASERVTAARTELARLDGLLAALPPEQQATSPLQTERTVAAATLDEALSTSASLDDEGPPPAPLTIVERGAAAEVTPVGVRAPEGKPQRALLLGAFGLLLGAGGAIASDRLDTRIRGKDDAEEAFGLPVIAEIPPMPGGRKHRAELFAVTQPASPFNEAYRALRTVVLYTAATAAHGDDQRNGHNPARKAGAAQHAEHECQVVLVTSPMAGEGKTTTAAHLAALLAEVGRSVLVVSADFRRPRIHELFGVERGPGLADVLTGASDVSIGDLRMDTNVPGVKLLPSGSPVTNPAPFLRETAQLIAAARGLFDYIVVDTAPLLVANDATELAGVADMVIVMARANRTSRDAARRSAEILERVEAPVVGSVIIAATDTPTAYRYYRDRYYSDVEADATPPRPPAPPVTTTTE